MAADTRNEEGRDFLEISLSDLTAVMKAVMQGDEKYFGPENFAKEVWRELWAINGDPLPEGTQDEKP